MGAFEGKVALVTGSARGIGRTIAEMLAAGGADLALCDLKEEWLADAKAAIEAMGRKVSCHAVDVGDAEAVTRTMDAVLEQHGHLDVLVNNAGITKDNLIIRMSEADWDAVIRVNLKGTFLFTKAAARPMMKQRSGAIVNVASIIGLIGNAGQCNYAASKAGVIALTKSSAKELASRHVRVNAVAPGYIMTAMTNSLSEDVQNKMRAYIPLDRYGTAEEVAKVVVFLAGDASSYVTGEVITVSGGMGM